MTANRKKESRNGCSRADRASRKETWNIFLKNKEKRGTMYENNSNH